MAIEDFKRAAPIAIEIEGETFVIELPTRWHRAYNRAWQMALADKVDAKGEIIGGQMAGMGILDAQQDAFARHCVLESPISIDDLLGPYLPLLAILQDTADSYAKAEEARADALTKKLSTSSSGNGDGRERPTSTKPSKRAGGLPLPI